MHNLITWLVPDRIIYTTIYGALKESYLPTIDRQMNNIFISSKHKNIHNLIDISMMTSMPGIHAMSRLSYFTHPQSGYFVTQRRNRPEQFIGNTVAKLLKVQYHFVDSLDDGIRFLIAIDNELPPEAMIRTTLHRIRNDFITTLPHDVLARS